jgi:hypothetical protein
MFGPASDIAGRRLAAVQVVVTNSATAREVATGFGVAEPTLWRWRDGYARDGVAGLLPRKKGPRYRSKLSEDKVTEINQLRRDGPSFGAIATRVGVSHDSVQRAFGPSLSGTDAGSDQTHGHQPPAPLIDRVDGRQAARAGMLEEAAPVITEGASHPLAGGLSILPVLVATDLLEAMVSVYVTGRRVAGVRRAVFYGLRSLVLCLVFSFLAGEPRADGLTRLDSFAIGGAPRPRSGAKGATHAGAPGRAGRR